MRLRTVLRLVAVLSFGQMVVVMAHMASGCRCAESLSGWLVLGSVVFLALLMLIVCWHFERSVGRPLVEVHRFIELLSAGRLDERLKVEGSAEVATLAQSVSRLADGLRKARAADELLKRLAAFPQFNPAPVVAVTLDGRIEYLNPAAKAQLKELEEKVTAHPWLSPWPDVLAAVRQAPDHVHRREVLVGDRYWMQVFLLVEDLKRVQIYGFDVTDRKLAEEQSASLARFPRENPNPVMRIAADGTILYANRAAEVFLNAWGEQVGGRAPDGWRPCVAQVTEAGRPAFFEVSCADRAYLCTVAPVSGQQYANVYAQDITNRVQAEQQLVRANRALRTLGRCNEVLIRAATEDELLAEVCKILVEVGGYRLAWVGRVMHDPDKTVMPVACSGDGADYVTKARITWADTDRGAGPTGMAVRTGQPCAVSDIETDPRFGPWREEAIKRGFGSSIALPIVVGDETIAVLNLYLGRDDPLSALERTLLRGLAIDLAYRITAIRERDNRIRAEEVQAELIGELESKNEELERFTYTVSHDLRSPLITIRGFLEYVEKAAAEGDLDALRADLGRISRAAGRMEQLLNELLELSRIGRLVNPPEDVSFVDIAREAVELCNGQIVRRGVTVVVQPDMPRVRVDKARLVGAVQNLVDNAVKFMGDQPQPRVEIGCHWHGGVPAFFVRDNGIGIDPVHHERVFGLFNKLDSQTDGTGMGLALVKRIIDVHGGRIWLDSAGHGKGSTFWFTLPLAQEPQHERAETV